MPSCCNLREAAKSVLAVFGVVRYQAQCRYDRVVNADAKHNAGGGSEKERGHRAQCFDAGIAQRNAQVKGMDWVVSSIGAI